MCLTTTQAETIKYYDRIKDKKEVKGYKIVIIHPVKHYDGEEWEEWVEIHSYYNHYRWQPGVNRAVIAKLQTRDVGGFVTKRVLVRRLGLHMNQRISSHSEHEIHEGIHVYLSRKEALAMLKAHDNSSLDIMTVNCSPDDLLGADTASKEAAFRQVRLSQREFNRLTKVRP